MIHCPLSAERRAQFNETAAQEEFLRVQGLDYGFSVFFFCFLDTPDDNWPSIMPAGFVPVFMSIVEKAGGKSFTDVIFGRALNMRLGTENLTMSELSHVAA